MWTPPFRQHVVTSNGNMEKKLVLVNMNSACLSLCSVLVARLISELQDARFVVGTWKLDVEMGHEPTEVNKKAPSFHHVTEKYTGMAPMGSKRS